MGRSVNKVTLIGTLGRDPEVRFMPNGNAVANINLATDESYNDKATGQKVEQTEWHRLTIYGRLAEIAQQYLHKGSRAYFEGRLKTREWEKDGVKRYTTEIVVNELMLLDRAGDNANQSAMPAATAGHTGFGVAPMQQQQQPMQQQPMHQPQAQHQPPAMQPQAASGYPQQQPNYGGYQPQPAAMQSAPMQPAAAPAPNNNFNTGFDDDIPF